MQHDREIIGLPKPMPKTALEEKGALCLLLRDGRLFGPFKSVSDAVYWCNANELNGFSTYTLLNPTKAP